MILDAVEIHVYLKSGCSLCDDALALLAEVSSQWRFTVRAHDILEDGELFQKYRYAVPVLVMQGLERLRLGFNRQELEAALLASGCPRE